MTYKVRKYKRPIFGFSNEHLNTITINKINQVHAFADKAYSVLKRLVLFYDHDGRPSNTLKTYVSQTNKWLKLWHMARTEYDPTDTEVINTIDGIAQWMEEHPYDKTDKIYYTYGDYKWIIPKSENFLPSDLTELLKVPPQINTRLAQSFWQQVEQQRRLFQMSSSTTKYEQP